MEDVKQTYSFNFAFNRKDIKKQLNNIAKDVKSAIEDIGKASDKVVVFKNLVSYLDDVDKAFEAFKNEHKDDFINLFGNIDYSLTSEIEKIFGILRNEMAMFSTLKDKISIASENNADLATLRKIATEVNTLYTAIGAKEPIDIDLLFTGKGSKDKGTDFQSRIKVLNDTLNGFATNFTSVQDKLQSGLSLGGGSGSGGIGNNMADGIKGTITLYDQLLEKVQEYDDALQRQNGVKFGSPEYNKLDVELENILDKIYELADVDDVGQIEKIADVISRLEGDGEEIRSVAQELSSILGISVPSSGPFGKVVNEMEYVQGIALQLEKLFSHINTMSGTIEYKVLINGQEIDIKEGAHKEVPFQTRMESFLGTLGKRTTVSAHNHPGGASSKTDHYDFKSIIEDVYSGVAAMGMTIGEKDLTTLNFANVALDDALEVLRQIKALDVESISAEQINELFQAINPKYTDVAQTWQPSQLHELAQYIYDVGESANIATDPLEKFQNILKIATDGKINLSKYKDLFDGFKIKDAGSIFNQIMELEGKDIRVADINTTSLSEFVEVVKHQQAALVQLRNDADVTYSDIHNMVKSYLSEIQSGSGVGEDASQFIKQYFGRNEQGIIQDWLYELENGESSILQITNRIAGYFKTIDPSEYLTDSMVAMQKAQEKVKSFMSLNDEIQGHTYSSLNDIEIGKYTERIDAAKRELDELGAQGLITAEELSQVQSAFDSSSSRLKDLTHHYTGYGDYDYSYSYASEYYEAQEENERLRADNETLKRDFELAKEELEHLQQEKSTVDNKSVDGNQTLKERIQLLKEIATAYEKQAAAQWELDEADTPKQEDAAERKLEDATEAVENFRNQYYAVIATLEDGSKINIKLDEEFGEEVENLLADVKKIQNIDIVPGNVGAAIEAYERINATKDNISRGISRSWGNVLDGKLPSSLEYLNRVKKDLETQISNISQSDPSGQWDFSSANQTAQELLSTINGMIPKFEMMVQMETRLQELNITPDPADFLDVIDAIKNGTFTTIDQCISKFKELAGIVDVDNGETNKYLVEAGAIERRNDAIENGNVLKNQENSIDSNDFTTNQDIDAENARLEQLKNTILNVERAVRAKTLAFEEEGATVSQTVAREIEALRELLLALGYIKAAINDINDIFMGSSAVYALPEGSNTSHTGAFGFGAVGGDYALDATLKSTNGILQNILGAVNGNDSINALVDPLKSAVTELTNVANGIAQHQKSQRTDLSSASEKIANNHSQLSDIAINAVSGLGNDIQLKGMKALADGVVRVEGAVKDANDVWNGFVVDINKSNQATVRQTNAQSEFAKALNDTAEAAKQAETKKQNDFTASLANKKSEFKKYTDGLIGVEYVSDELRDKINALGAELQNVVDEGGLITWNKSFKEISEEVSSVRSTFEKINLKHVSDEANKLHSAFNALNNEQKIEVQDEYEQAVSELEKYKTSVKDGKKVELDALYAVTSAIHQKIETYKEANREAKKAQQVATKNQKFGSTAEINATAKYNTLNDAAGRKEFAGSTVVQNALNEYKKAYDALIAKRKELGEVDGQLSTEQQADFKRLQAECNNYANALNKIITDSQKLADHSSAKGLLGADFDDSIVGRKAALLDFIEITYGASANVVKFKDDYNTLVYTVDNGNGTFTKMTATINAARTAIGAISGETEKQTTALGRFFSELGSKFKSIGTYLAASLGWQEIWQQIRKGVEYVREIDSALTELKKVTDETEESYDAFLQTMSRTAGDIGSTVADLTTMAAEWSRLGYSMADSAKLAESTAILLNVSEFDDATTASEALISTMQAFQYTASQSEHVVDILNEVGKLLPVDNYIG